MDQTSHPLASLVSTLSLTAVRNRRLGVTTYTCLRRSLNKVKISITKILQMNNSAKNMSLP